MNSQITNLLQLVPVSAVKNDKQLVGMTPSLDIKAVADSGSNKIVSVSSKNQDISVSLLEAEEKKQADRKPSLEVVKKAAKEGNSILQAIQRNLEFKVDDKTSELVVKIVDSETGKLVRQIPSDEMLAYIKRMQELYGEQGSVIHDRA